MRIRQKHFQILLIFRKAKMMKEALKLLTLTLTSFSLANCSSTSLNNKIELSTLDILSEESMMRYDSKRIDRIDSLVTDVITKASLACHQNKFIKGFGLLENSMQENKNNPFYWNALGTCYLINNDSNKAIFFYSIGLEAIRSAKNVEKSLAEATLYNNIGLIHLNYKRYNEAYDMLNKSILIQPNLFTPKFNLAQLYLEFNFNDKALALLKALEAINPNDVDLLFGISLIHFRNKDYKKSLQTLKKIKNDYLNRADIVGLYAYNLLLNNQLEEAKKIIEKRLFADEFDDRNKIVQDEINEKIKESKKIITK